MTDGPAPTDPDLQGRARDGWGLPEQPLPHAAAQPNRPLTESSTKRGRTAVVMAICVISVSVVWSVLIGLFGTTVCQYNDVSSHGFQVGFNAQPNLVAAGFQILLGSVFGIWSLVQGIIATATNQGRRFGIAAIVIAGAAPLLSLIIWTVVGLIAGSRVTQ